MDKTKKICVVQSTVFANIHDKETSPIVSNLIQNNMCFVSTDVSSTNFELNIDEKPMFSYRTQLVHKNLQTLLCACFELWPRILFVFHASIMRAICVVTSHLRSSPIHNYNIPSSRKLIITA
jgi:hypothetical protein